MNKNKIILLSVLFCIFISLVACGPPEDVSAGEDPAVSANRSMYSNTDLTPPTELPEKEDSILERRLRELVEAYKKGEAGEYAKKRGIKLVDTGVRVLIQCKPGRIESVAENVKDLGVVPLVYGLGIEVDIPISKLETLADIPDIRSIGIPPKPTTP